MLTELIQPDTLKFAVPPTAVTVGVVHPYADIPIGHQFDIAYCRCAPNNFVECSFTLTKVVRMGRDLSKLPFHRAAICVFETDGTIPDVVSTIPPRVTSTVVESTAALCTADDWATVRQQKCDNPLVFGDFGSVTDDDISQLAALITPFDPRRTSIAIHDADSAHVSALIGGNSIGIQAERSGDAWVAVETQRGLV